MKTFGFIFAVTLFAIFAIADIIHDFVTNDPVHYFSEQPHQLLIVAAIAIIGGLAALIFYRLSPHWQRRAKLLTLGLAAGFATLAGGYFSIWLARLPSQLDSAIPSHGVLAISLGTVSVAGLLWFEFYQVFKKRAL